MHQVSYTSKRGEVWRWYWRAWARPLGLWRIHVALSLLLATAWTLRAKPADLATFIAALMVALPILILFLSLYPQIRFKPETRILTVDANGWTTQIGNLQGSRTWDKVRSIDDSPEAIALVGSNGNAMIVPNRAFSTSAAREEFLHDVRRWRAAVAV